MGHFGDPQPIRLLRRQYGLLLIQQGAELGAKPVSPLEGALTVEQERLRFFELFALRLSTAVDSRPLVAGLVFEGVNPLQNEEDLLPERLVVVPPLQASHDGGLVQLSGCPALDLFERGIVCHRIREKETVLTELADKPLPLLLIALTRLAVTAKSRKDALQTRDLGHGNLFHGTP